jgi:two-component sensor histidine kinase
MQFSKLRKVLDVASILERMEELLEREKTAKIICSELNNFVDLKPTLITVIEHIKRLTGCEAVSIRLHDEGDYPYYVYDGFPESFIMHENSLCARDANGNRIPSADGDGFLLECMCGNIIRGRFDPSLSFFTEKGSFWSNNTSSLLDTSSEQDRQGKTRNYCNAVGYESVALIPIKAGDERIGLIQINDRRTGMFTEDLVEYCEMIGEQIGISIQNSMIYERLNRSHEEIELLYKEINHRVKNNLAMITGFLGFKIRSLEDGEAKTALLESRNRVMTIALLHESIYKARDITSVNMKEYIYPIVSNLISVFSINSGEIGLDFEVEDFTLDIDRAISMGIAINEIVTNSLKHAFEGRDEGKILVRSRVENNFVSFTIKDNGIGIRDNIDIESSKSLGLQIVRAIVKRLDATMAIRNDSGTEIVIKLPLKSIKDR